MQIHQLYDLHFNNMEFHILHISLIKHALVTTNSLQRRKGPPIQHYLSVNRELMSVPLFRFFSLIFWFKVCLKSAESITERGACTVKNNSG